MRKLLVSLAAAGTMLTLAAPASAQWAQRSHYGYNPGARGQLQRDIQDVRIQRDNLARSGRLTRREARDLDKDIRALQFSVAQASRRGLSPWEVRNLQNRVYQVRMEIRRYSDNDHRRRYDGRGYGRRY